MSAKIGSISDLLGNRSISKRDIFLTTMKIRGSQAYNRKMYSDLMAMVIDLGPPTGFLTLSANDLGWEDLWNLLQARGKTNAYAKRAYETIPFKERNKILNENPVICARHFMYRLRALLRLIILNANASPLGKVEDYFIRIEFQLRGSPHAHILLLVENVPDFNSPEGIKYIDRVVTCALPKDKEFHSLVTRLQMHRHSQTCYKKKRMSVVSNFLDIFQKKREFFLRTRQSDQREL